MTAADLKRGWCPSLLRPMESGDGWLVRVRPRAAVITAAVARAVAAAATEYGNGRIEITNRANLQIRGLRPETILPFVEAMEAVGAADEAESLPIVLVSPLAGADPGVAEGTLELAHSVTRGLDPLAYPVERPDGVGAPSRVDARVEPAHDELGWSPKFGILIDGGGALPLTGLSLDINLRAEGGRWFLNGVEVPAGEAASRALSLARTLPHTPRRTSNAPALGFYGCGAVLLAPAFGQLHAAQLAALAGLAERCGDGALRPTPWKSLAIAGVAARDERLLRDQANQIHIISDPTDRRLGIVTCVGAPACVRGQIDTHAAAGALAGARGTDDPLLHLSGCVKGCARPGPTPVTLVGEDGGFAFIRDGRPGDDAVARGLTLAQSAALMQSVPA